MSLSLDSLLSAQAYARIRQAERQSAIAHRRLRRVRLGAHMLLQFEDERTVRRALQELVHARGWEDPGALRDELVAHTTLVPDGSNWKATLLLDYPDTQQRHRALVLLRGVERRIYVQADEAARLYAFADEDLGGRDCGGRTCSVHFLRFELPDALRRRVLQGAPVWLGCDHPHYLAQLQLPDATRASLADDLCA